MIKEISEYIGKHEKWYTELSLLRDVLLSTELTECIKWGMPTYTFENKNVVSLSAFKNHCGLWFFHGNLLKDKHNLLSNAQEGKTKGMRHYKIYQGDAIDVQLIKSYILEAIQNQKEGKVENNKPQKSKNIKEYEIDLSLKKRLDTDTLLKNQFLKLTKIQQRDYCNYIAEAKRASTKESRLEKIIPLIMEGNSLYNLWKKK